MVGSEGMAKASGLAGGMRTLAMTLLVQSGSTAYPRKYHFKQLFPPGPHTTGQKSASGLIDVGGFPVVRDLRVWAHAERR
jgi:hypothetical protein